MLDPHDPGEIGLERKSTERWPDVRTAKWFVLVSGVSQLVFATILPFPFGLLAASFGGTFLVVFGMLQERYG